MRNRTSEFERQIERGKRCARCQILFSPEYPRAAHTNLCDECAERRPLIQVPLDVSRIIAPLSQWIADMDIVSGNLSEGMQSYYRNREKRLAYQRRRYARMKRTRGGGYGETKRERAQTLD